MFPAQLIDYLIAFPLGSVRLLEEGMRTLLKQYTDSDGQQQ